MGGARVRWLDGLGWVALALAAARFGVVVSDQLAWPLDLEFETLQLRTVRVIEAGLNPYAPGTYADLPFVFSVYTPLYHLLVAALPEVAGRPFLVGRLLALAATGLVAAGLFVVDGRRTRRALAAFACGWFLLLWPIAGHSAYMRQEPLGLLCSAAAVLLLARGGTRAAAGAAACGLLALGFKQSFVAPLLTGLLWLPLARRFAELRAFGLTLLGLGGAAALGATLLWGPGFWFCTTAGTVDAWSGRQYAHAWAEMARQPAFVALIGLGALLAAASAGRGAAVLRESPYPAYALVTLVLLQATVGKVGSHMLYFLELILAVLMWAAFALGRASPLPRSATLAGLVVLALFVHDVATSGSRHAILAWPETSPEAGRAYADDARAGLAQRGLTDPLALNLGPLRVVGAVVDDFAVNDALLYDRLFRTGKLSPEPLLAAVRRRAFDLVLLARQQPMPPADGAHDPMSRVLAAVAENYRLLGRDSVLQYFVRP